MEKNKFPDGTDPNFPVKIYTDGVFDCFHYGHALLLKGVKEMYPYVYVMVGVCGDQMTNQEKGKTILTEYERYESVRHCKYVDQVVENAPWVPSVKFLDEIGAHYIAHDPEPYPMGDCPDVYGEIKTAGRFLATKRTEGISTSDIMMRIIRNFDDYVERSIKKGASSTDLNIKLNQYFAFKTKIITKKVDKKVELMPSNPLSRCFKKWIFVVNNKK